MQLIDTDRITDWVLDLVTKVDPNWELLVMHVNELN